MRIPENKSYIEKIDNKDILIPADDPWKTLFDSLDLFTDDFLSERQQPIEQQTRKISWVD